ncbi:MAG: hypothetical protein FJ279_18505 [Planctomycetes bacterium]|nr:hypothetical protein [Planctomycetota bacterium]
MKKVMVVAVVCGCLGFSVGCSSVDDRSPQPFAQNPGYGYAGYPASPYYYPYAYPSVAYYGQPMVYGYPGQPVVAPQTTSSPAGTSAEPTSDRRTMQAQCWRCRQLTTASSGVGMNCRSCGALNWIP